jgi:hypothetical protein
MLGKKLADHMGASALLYAAIAYFVFDDSFYLEDITDNNPDMEEELQWWCDDIYSTCYTLFDNLRTFYETTDKSSGSGTNWRTRKPFRLLTVVYYEPDEDLYIQASRRQSDYHVGNEWRVLTERGESPRRNGLNPRATIQVPVRRSWKAPSKF